MIITRQELDETMRKAIKWGKDGRFEAAIARLIAKLESGELSIDDLPPLPSPPPTDEEIKALNFNLSELNAACAHQWRYVFKHAQLTLAPTLEEALVSYPGPLDDHGDIRYPTYRVVVYPPGDFKIEEAEGEAYLVNDEIRHAALIIGACDQPDGIYIFANRYCLCPDGSALFYD